MCTQLSLAKPVRSFFFIQAAQINALVAIVHPRGRNSLLPDLFMRRLSSAEPRLHTGHHQYMSAPADYIQPGSRRSRVYRTRHSRRFCPRNKQGSLVACERGAERQLQIRRGDPPAKKPETILYYLSFQYYCALLPSYDPSAPSDFFFLTVPRRNAPLQGYGFHSPGTPAINNEAGGTDCNNVSQGT
jgi:hypothetical protein